MSGLVKATLQRIWSDDERTETDGEPLEVQFNPASLRLALSNTVEGGHSRGRQARQFIGKSSTELSFELVFDTADETSGGGRPRSVREKTALVEQFVVPEVRGQDKQAPPKVRFQWNDLIIDGVISSLTIEMDLFASDGTPLRAKMGVSIKEQDARYEFLRSGPGANRDNAPPPGARGAGAPGGGNVGATDRSAFALAGESAADFAARMGLDPTAWRGLSASLEGTLSLSAGLEIDFSSALSAGGGLGLSAGFQAGASASLEASFGLEATGGVEAARSAGFALSAAGGVGAAIETVRILKTEAAAVEARRAFDAPPATPTRTGALPRAPGTSARPSRPEQPRGGLALTGMPSPAQQGQVPRAPPPPQADPRAVTYGFGVPLRPRAGVTAVDARAAALAGRPPLRLSRSSGEVPVTRDPAVPPWTRLPGDDRARAVADARQARAMPQRACGCAGRCGHRGGGPWR